MLVLQVGGVETILYYTIIYYTILYYTILYYTILYYTILLLVENKTKTATDELLRYSISFQTNRSFELNFNLIWQENSKNQNRILLIKSCINQTKNVEVKNKMKCTN